MRIAHVVVTDSFAGTERYIADVAVGAAQLGHEVVVIGGSGRRMPEVLGDHARWLPSAAPSMALRTLRAIGKFDIVHAHLTYADAAAVLTRRAHGGQVISTRHIARRRGQGPAGRILRGYITRHIDREIAISEFVADAVGLPPSTVLVNGVRFRDSAWRPSSKTVVMAQRLEPEKDTATGLRGWHASGLAGRGWQLLIAGAGSERPRLEALVANHQIAAVEFLGEVTDMTSLWSQTGVLLAPAVAEPLGLTVLEAMSAGVPVVASDAGGHLETIGRVSRRPSFRVGDAAAIGRALAEISSDSMRRDLSSAGRRIQQQHFDLDRHVEKLLDIYRYLPATKR